MQWDCFFPTRQECRVPFGIRPSVQHLWPYSRMTEVVALSDGRKYIKFKTAYPQPLSIVLGRRGREMFIRSSVRGPSSRRRRPWR